MAHTEPTTTASAPLIMGVSGLRGIVGQSLTPELALRYAAAFGCWLGDRLEHTPTVVVARDGRAGGAALAAAAAAGLAGVGCDVIDLGVATTPTAGIACDAMDTDGAIQITASHNPQEWNGLKCLVRLGGVPARAPTADDAEAIIARFRDGPIAWTDGVGAGRVRTETGADELHVGAVAGALGTLSDEAQFTDVMPAFRVVADSVNSSGARVLSSLASGFGLSLAQLAGTDSGVFPRVPEPTAENCGGEGGLCAAVPALRADVGLAQDPDADRLALIDEDGRYIGEEYTLVLAATALLSARVEEEDDDRQPVIVVNLSTSRMIDDVADRFGARVERTAVGEANVVSRMVELMDEGQLVVMGGEGNGGVIWPELTLIRDSIGAAALTLSLLALSGKSVSALVQEIDGLAPGGAGYTILKRKVAIASKAGAVPAVEAVAKWAAGQRGMKVDRQDGVRVDVPDWQGGGAAWVHVRASNTEPIMRLIAEAGREEHAAALLATVEAAISKR